MRGEVYKIRKQEMDKPTDNANKLWTTVEMDFLVLDMPPNGPF